jgi:XTP/dITP diphosphohydrolase
MIKAGNTMLSIEKLLIATTNQHKLAEFRHLLADCTCKILAPHDLDTQLPPVEETGETLAENARLKATCWAKASGLWTLADDTGLEVDALDGQPGVRSARYAGQHATMEQNREKLLNQLRPLGNGSLVAKFRCVLVLADPQGIVHFDATGTCHGEMLKECAGENGFGYDSLFWVSAAGKTLAAMNREDTARYSHRAMAVQELRCTISIFSSPSTRMN